MKYKINEIFKSVQGEGVNLGKEVIFIRLANCNLNCKFCDTKHNEYKELYINEIIEILEKLKCRNVIITGGEPTIQNLTPLLNTLNKKYWIGLETNGTNDIKNIRTYIDFIACSPKIIVHSSIYLANEIRIVNNNLNINDILKYEKYDIKFKFISVLEKNNYFNLYETIKLLAEVNERVENKWILNQQIHKILNIK
jgi:7-carboxy-7-deazaguanine synthase